MTTCTSRSCLVNLLAMSAALYAAIEAVIPSTMFIGPSFNILDLLADLFQFGFAVNDNLRDFGVVRFCAECVQLAADLLADEFERASDRFFFIARFYELIQMRFKPA